MQEFAARIDHEVFLFYCVIQGLPSSCYGERNWKDVEFEWLELNSTLKVRNIVWRIDICVA